MDLSTDLPNAYLWIGGYIWTLSHQLFMELGNTLVEALELPRCLLLWIYTQNLKTNMLTKKRNYFSDQDISSY